MCTMQPQLVSFLLTLWDWTYYLCRAHDQYIKSEVELQMTLTDIQIWITEITDR